MSEVNMTQLLEQMRAMSLQAAGQSQSSEQSEKAGGEFAALLKTAVDQVNATQQDAGSLAKSFDQGDPTVNLAEVMVSIQKANISFQAMTEVRNRLLSAYQEIMSMQV